MRPLFVILLLLSTPARGLLLVPDEVKAPKAPVKVTPTPAKPAAPVKAPAEVRTAVPIPPLKPVVAPEPLELKPTKPLDPVTPPQPTLPPAPVKKACSDRTEDVKEMIHQVVGFEIFDIGWREDSPKYDAQGGKILIKNVKGQVRITMTTGDGQTLGEAPANFCLRTEHGKQILRVGLNRSYLKFGRRLILFDVDAAVDELLAKLPNSHELPFVLTKSKEAGKINFSDAISRKYVNSPFTAER